MRISLKKLKARLLANPEVKARYDLLAPTDFAQEQIGPPLSGYRVRSRDPGLSKQMAVARKIAKKRKNALQELSR